MPHPTGPLSRRFSPPTYLIPPALRPFPSPSVDTHRCYLPALYGLPLPPRAFPHLPSHSRSPQHPQPPTSTPLSVFLTALPSRPPLSPALHFTSLPSLSLFVNSLIPCNGLHPFPFRGDRRRLLRGSASLRGGVDQRSHGPCAASQHTHKGGPKKGERGYMGAICICGCAQVSW